jgi:hypothetical protein
MLPAYDDIRSRIAEPPLWHDRHGVPRYEPFKPQMLGVYDDLAVLAEIACQRCAKRFLVGAGWTRLDVFADPIVVRKLADLAESFDYGDPPRHAVDAGRCAGETMSSDVVQIVEAWERVGLDWVRLDLRCGEHPDVQVAPRRTCVACGAAFDVNGGGLYWHADAGGPVCERCDWRWGE